MLRSVISRPQAASWNRLDSSFRHWPRNASSNSSNIQDPSKSRRLKFSWPYPIRRRIIRHRSQLRLLSWLAPFTLASFLFMHIETNYFYSFDVTYGISMLPTINPIGDSVIISKLYRRGKNVEVGDIVSFAHPVDQGVHSIKRVIGMEGDWVCRDTPGVGSGMVIQIPKGHCWVVGDNLGHSRDSRLFGPLPMALIKGKVLARYKIWPSWLKLWSDFEWLENGMQPALEDGVD